MSEQSPRRCFWTIHMTQSKVYSYRALYIYTFQQTLTWIFFLFLQTFLSIQSFRTIAHAQYFLPHFIRGIFDFLICSLHFMRLSQEEKKEATPLFEWVSILSWWLFAFLSDVLVPFWSLPYWSSSADCQLYTTVCLISKVEIILECCRQLSCLRLRSLSCNHATHIYTYIQPLTLTTSFPTPTASLFLSVSILQPLGLSGDPRCLSEVFVSDMFRCHYRKFWLNKTRGRNNKIVFSCNMDVAVIQIDQVKYKDNPVCPVPSYR